MHYVLLALAILVEVAATATMTKTDGFTKPLPTAAVLVGYLISFTLLAQTLDRIQVSVAYAIWSAAGTALITAVGIAALDEPASALKLTGIVLVIGGVVILNLTGSHS